MCPARLTKGREEIPVKSVIKLKSLVLLMLLPLAISACGQSGAAEEITVFAAASLTEVVEEYQAQFEEEHPGVTVRVNLAGTQEIRTQLEQGAAADVFLSADEEHLAALLEQKLVEEPRLMAINHLVIISPAAGEFNPASPRDLTQNHRLVLANPQVPAGKYARQILKNLEQAYGPSYSEAVLENLVSEETNVRQVLTKVALGEADAALVYATDAAQAEGIRVLEIPPEYNLEARYPGAVVTSSAHPELARAFLDGLGKSENLWRAFGFGLPAS